MVVPEQQLTGLGILGGLFNEGDFVASQLVAKRNPRIGAVCRNIGSQTGIVGNGSTCRGRGDANCRQDPGR